MNPLSTDSWPTEKRGNPVPMPLPSGETSRRFASLRLSLTARCNFACRYCVTDARSPGRLRGELGADEMSQALQLLAQMGLKKLRITGGEPLLSASLEPVLQTAAKLRLDDVALTTNGSLLARRLPLLVRHRLSRINLSLDSLRKERFYRLSRGGNLAQVLAGLDAAVQQGIPVKVNTVLLRGENDEEIQQLLEFCLQRGIELRFIELMRMGHLYDRALWQQSFVGQDEILAEIGRRWKFSPLPVSRSATARRWQLEGGGIFGIIANESEPFCAGCDRLRMTADGKLYGCISSRRGFDIRPLLSLDNDEALLRLGDIFRAALREKSADRFRGGMMVMKMLGG